MNICIDVGNTTVNIGFFKEENLIDRITFNTDFKKTSDQFYSIIKQQIEIKNIDIKNVDNIIYSSVVPAINLALKQAIKEIFNKDIMLISPGLKTGLIINVDNPNEIGNDLIADLVGAKEKYGAPSIICDLGTASKVLLLDKNNKFLSCLITPGITLSAESLTHNAALLPEVSLETPKSIMAKNTIEAMNGGIVFGHALMIKGLVEKYEVEIGYKTKHILTGGGAIYVKDILKDDFIYDRDLNLIGLNTLIKKNRGN